MPNNHRFWSPAHEAGHATVAIAQGVMPNYAILAPREAPRGGKVDLPDNRQTTPEKEFRFASSGAAGEMYVYATEKDHLPSDAMTDAILDRASRDIDGFAANADTKVYNTDVKVKNAFLRHARLNSLNDIKANLEIFKLIREHLDTHGFMGRASLELAAQRMPATPDSLRKDAAQRASDPELK